SSVCSARLSGRAKSARSATRYVVAPSVASTPRALIAQSTASEKKSATEPFARIDDIRPEPSCRWKSKPQAAPCPASLNDLGQMTKSGNFVRSLRDLDPKTHQHSMGLAARDP